MYKLFGMFSTEDITNIKMTDIRPQQVELEMIINHHKNNYLDFSKRSGRSNWMSEAVTFGYQIKGVELASNIPSQHEAERIEQLIKNLVKQPSSVGELVLRLDSSNGYTITKIYSNLEQAVEQSGVVNLLELTRNPKGVAEGWMYCFANQYLKRFHYFFTRQQRSLSSPTKGLKRGS